MPNRSLPVRHASSIAPVDFVRIDRPSAVRARHPCSIRVSSVARFLAYVVSGGGVAGLFCDIPTKRLVIHFFRWPPPSAGRACLPARLCDRLLRETTYVGRALLPCLYPTFWNGERVAWRLSRQGLLRIDQRFIAGPVIAHTPG